MTFGNVTREPEMFTGIVTGIGTVVETVAAGPTLTRLAIASPYETSGIEIGASIACAGICLTVTALEPRRDGQAGCIFRVEAAAETLVKTRVSAWRVGERINLERSLKIGDARPQAVRLRWWMGD